MLEALPTPEPMAHRQWTTSDGRAGLGTTHSARVGRPAHFAQDLTHRVTCVFEGVIYPDTGAPGEHLIETDGAAFMLRRYLESGTDCLGETNGSFNVAWWDEKRDRLVLANDKVGQRLLFWGLQAGTLVFASMLARIMAAGIASPEIDAEGLADLLSYEYILGERTLFQDVHALPPAGVLTVEDGKVHIHRYWRLDEVEAHGSYDDARLDRLVHLFERAVRRSLRPDLNCAIDLTGGLDSRCILAAAAHQRLPFATRTGGQPNSTDVKLAKELADRVGARHSFRAVGPESLGEWLVPMVRHQGGMVATLHSHPCRNLYVSPAFDATIQGIGGEFARGFWVSPPDLGILDLAAQKPARLRRQLLTKTTQHLEQIWKPEFRRVGLEAPQEHLNALLLAYRPQDSPVAAVEYFYLHERCRKFLNKSTLIVRGSREVYFPYLDHEWIEALAAIPTSERVTQSIQVDLIEVLCPTLLDIPTTKGLVPLSASPWKTWMIKRYRGIKRRVAQRLGATDRAWARVPNHYYSRWIRKEMRGALMELLYHPDAAFRTYLRWDTVETLLNQHFSGQDDWKALVAALTVFEIAHRLWMSP
jgi:hypothetical protein